MSNVGLSEVCLSRVCYGTIQRPSLSGMVGVWKKIQQNNIICISGKYCVDLEKRIINAQFVDTEFTYYIIDETIKRKAEKGKRLYLACFLRAEYPNNNTFVAHTFSYKNSWLLTSLHAELI